MKIKTTKLKIAIDTTKVKIIVEVNLLMTGFFSLTHSCVMSGPKIIIITTTSTIITMMMMITMIKNNSNDR